jgi:hypothetical protein
MPNNEVKADDCPHCHGSGKIEDDTGRVWGCPLCKGGIECGCDKCLLRTLTAEVERLRSQIGGFPHLDDLRMAMVLCADENKRLTAEVERLKSENEKLYNSLPFYGNRDKDKAREALGQVHRHSTTEEKYPEIGVVEVNRAVDALVQSYAECNALNVSYRELAGIAERMDVALKNCGDIADGFDCWEMIQSEIEPVRFDYAAYKKGATDA